MRDKARIDEVVGDYVTLRNAGGGAMKGLCPFHDEKSPSFHVTPSRNLFHCLAGGTRVVTWHGARPIRELAGGTHRVLGSSGQWVDAPFASYGVQRLWRITLTRNTQTKEILATDEHRWFVRSGRRLDTRRETLTRDLRPGDGLAYTVVRSRIHSTAPSPFGVAHGFTYGDGTRAGRGSQALVCPPKDSAMLKYFPLSATYASGKDLLVTDLPGYFAQRPSIEESASYLYGWLAGYFAADGRVAADGTVMMNSAHREDLEFVRTVCTRLGIGTYGITEQQREGFPEREPRVLYRVHLVDEDLRESFFLVQQHRERFLASPTKHARRGWVVREVEETDLEEEVFCADVEDGHAFVLEDDILTGNCFGCQAGGDVIKFVMDIDGLSFTDTVESLAGKYGVTLRYEEGGPSPEQRRESSMRPRLLEAHKLAQEWYADQLTRPEALAARQFLGAREFGRDDATLFGIGYAPRGERELVTHLKQKGFTDDELITGNLANRGRYDRFQGRLLWPIRDTAGSTIGFGARKLYDDDRIEAKYLNTSETPIYKKSQVLYGLDLARREMAKTSQAVVVEGYTDVMACHLSGVGTAVATCGTAFGEEHARVLRRLLHDHEDFRGEVIFTFDGDEAGQRAALKAFQGDQQFSAQTYVAVEPTGVDPCELRQRDGDAAVRELVARRVPLYRFVLGNVLGRYDLDRADGRIDAVREAARLVASVRDRSKVTAFAQEISRMVGSDLDTNQVLDEVRRAQRRVDSGERPATPERRTPRREAEEEVAPAPPRAPLPDLRDPRFTLERETLKLVVQVPSAVGRMAADVDAGDFVHPVYREVWRLVSEAGGPSTASGQWAQTLTEAAPDQVIEGAISQLAVEPVKRRGEVDRAYVAQHVFGLQELTALRRIADLKSRLQRTNPVDHATEYNKMFGELVALEQTRRALREQAVGDA